MSSAGKKTFLIILICWVVADLLQAVLMEVHSDEAYYFLYGQHPAWGYYDHPPMTGWAVWLSSHLSDGNLGVRLLTVLTHAATLLTVWAITGIRNPDRKQVGWFLITAASCIMFQAYGFMTTPDPYLLFFTALFLLSYRRFLHKESWGDTLLLALSMTGMLYSKYHGVLVILLTVISYPRLLAKPKAWAAVAVTAVLMLPHLFWQAANDFPAVRYHLSARSTGFSFGDMLGYLPVQLAVFNPVTVYAFVSIVLRTKAEGQFEKTCRYLFIGFIAFFFLMTFKGHVEPQWTVAASIPLILVVFRHTLVSERLQRMTRIWMSATVVLTVIARILLLTPVLPESLGFHGKQQQYTDLAEKTGTDIPVVFYSSFQNPSLFLFFNGGQSTALSSVTTRTTQFDIWRWEEQWQGKPVWMVDRAMDKAERIEHFQSANRLEIRYSLASTPDNWPDIQPGDSISLQYTILNPNSYGIDLNHPEMPLELRAVFSEHLNTVLCSGRYTVSATALPPATEDNPSTISGTLSITVPEMELGRKVKMGLVLDNGYCAPLLSPVTKVRYHGD